MNLVVIGIILAFVAALFWGFGDFFIQKATRKVGSWEALFVISIIGVIILAPFSWTNFLRLFQGSDFVGVFILVASGVVLFMAAMLDFAGMKIGKLAIIEPLWSIEIISASIISYVVLKEALSPLQICLIAALIVCFILLSIRERGSIKLRHFFIERGVMYAVLGTILMGVADFFLGWGSRVADPITANFFIDLILVAISGSYLIFNGRFQRLVRDFRHNPILLIKTSVLDKIGWVAYAFAMSLAPIGIVTALSEASIIVAVGLGLFVSNEKIQHHQKIGLVGAIVCAIVLGFFSH